MSQAIEMTKIKPAENLWFMTGLLVVGLSNKDNEERISMIEHRMPFDFAPPRHVHHDENETFRILRGTFRFQLADDIMVLTEGDSILLPKGVPHGFRVISPEGGDCLTITSGKFEDMVRAASRPAPSATMPKACPPTLEQQQRLAEICAKHGIDFVGPPIG